MDTPPAAAVSPATPRHVTRGWLTSPSYGAITAVSAAVTAVDLGDLRADVGQVDQDSDNTDDAQDAGRAEQGEDRGATGGDRHPLRFGQRVGRGKRLRPVDQRMPEREAPTPVNTQLSTINTRSAPGKNTPPTVPHRRRRRRWAPRPRNDRRPPDKGRSRGGGRATGWGMLRAVTGATTQPLGSRFEPGTGCEQPRASEACSDLASATTPRASSPSSSRTDVSSSTSAPGTAKSSIPTTSPPPNPDGLAEHRCGARPG